MARDDGDETPVVCDRNGFFAHGHSAAPLGIALADDAAFAPRPIDQRALAFRDPLANLVFDVRGLRRHGPDLRDVDETRRIACVHPKQQVGKRQVGEKLPFADEQMKPLEVGVGQVGVSPDQIDEIRHEDRLDKKAGLSDQAATLRP